MTNLVIKEFVVFSLFCFASRSHENETVGGISSVHFIVEESYTAIVLSKVIKEHKIGLFGSDL